MVVRLGVGPLRLEALLQPALATLLVGRFGLMGAWIAMGLDLNLRGFAMWLRFRGEHWTQSVFRHPEQFANDHGQLV